MKYIVLTEFKFRKNNKQYSYAIYFVLRKGAGKTGENTIKQNCY